MPQTNLIQTDFLAGEISPRIEMQSGLEGRKHGVELMKNFFPHLQGSAETSRGFEWVSEVAGVRGRLFGFPSRASTAFMVVVSSTGRLKVYNYLGLARSGDQITNGYFNQAGTGWSTERDIDGAVIFSLGAATLSRGYSGLSTVSLSQNLTPASLPATLVIGIAKGGSPLTVRVGSVIGANDILSTTIQGVGRHSFEGLSSISPDLFIQIILEDGDEDVVISDVHVFDASIGDADFEFPTLTSSDLDSLRAIMYPGEDKMLLLSKSAPPQVLSTISTGAWSLTPLPLTSPPGVWSTGDRPVAATFFAGRLWIGGAAGAPNTFWGSTTDDYGDFTLGSLPADALEIDIDRSGAIQWVAGGTNLMVGTSTSEVIVTSEGGVITPDDNYSRLQSTNGSLSSQALEIGNEIMYISSDGRKIRSIGYEWVKDAWRSRDLTYASEHITQGENDVFRIVYSANPDSTIIAVTRSGELIIATYEPYSQTAGFARRDTQGSIVDASVVSFGGSDELWVLVNRGGDRLELEKERLPGNVKLDSYMEFVSGTPISGGTAAHLANKDCQVLVDGAVHPNVTPDGSGAFTVEYAGNEILIGLQIDSYIRTLPIADEISNVGSTRSMNKRFNELWVRIIDSWPPRINGRRPATRRPATLMGEVEPPRTENLRVSNEGWSQDAQITIEQDLPLRTEVAGWFGSIIQGDI